jgi:glutaredoxin
VRTLALALFLSLAACGQGGAGGSDASLPPLVFADDAPGLLLTWLDERGDGHSANAPTEVPVEARALVRVVLATSQDGTGDLYYVVDLREKSAAGTYAARSMKKSEWEKIVAARRAKFEGQAAASGSALPSGAPTAIVYGASWCEPCKHAEEYLRKKGVWVVVKDVEKSPAAAREMSEKLDRAGKRGAAIPVLELRGRLLVGFDPVEVDRALQPKQGATTL